jgi:hypothetical protein
MVIRLSGFLSTGLLFAAPAGCDRRKGCKKSNSCPPTHCKMLMGDETEKKVIKLS